MRRTEKMGIEELLDYMMSADIARTPRRRGEKAKQHDDIHQGKLRNLSVSDFYEHPFTVKSEEISDTLKSWTDGETSGPEAYREKMFKRLESYIGLLIPGVSIKELGMKKLANIISETLDREDMHLQERMQWYELCYILVSEMDMSKKAILDYLMVRPDRLEAGAPGLSRKLEIIGRKETIKPMRRTRKPIELDALIRMMTKERHEPCVKLMHKKMEQYVFDWVWEKNISNSQDKGDFGAMWGEEANFCDRVKGYGHPLNGTENVVQYISKVTVDFWEELQGKASPRRIMRLYELCYELIHLMADDSVGLGHRTLMQIRKNECCSEGEELQDFELGEADRLERIAKELMREMDGDTHNGGH